MSDVEHGGVERGNSWRMRAIIIAVLAMVAVAAIGFMFMSASSDRDDAQRDLAAAEGEAAALEAQVATVQRAMDDAAENAAAAAAELQAQVSAAEDARDTAESALAALEGRMSEVEKRAGQADELEAGIVDFLAVAFQQTGMGEDEAVCVSGSMIENGDAAAILQSFADVGTGFGSPGIFGLTADLLTAAGDCGLDPDELFGSGLLPGFTYGDNEALDVLWDDCADGDGAACDQLYSTSEVESEYEFFGATCGERFTLAQAPIFCEGEI